MHSYFANLYEIECASQHYHRTLRISVFGIFHKELVRSAITRFATNFLSLQSLVDQKVNLWKMFSCDEWNECQWSQKAEGKDIVDKVFEKTFWKKAEEIVLFSEPLVSVADGRW